MPDILHIEKPGDAMAPVGLREDPSLTRVHTIKCGEIECCGSNLNPCI